MSIPDVLRNLLACPWCLGRLEDNSGRLCCAACRAAYGTEDGIPRMTVEDAELVCPFCDAAMEKRPPRARCPACGRRFRMDRRVSGSLRDHTEQ